MSFSHHRQGESRTSFRLSHLWPPVMGGRRAGPTRSASISLLLDLLDEAFDRQSWHGTTLRGSLRGLSTHLATWWPAASRHNVWEVVLHCAYWKYAVRRRLAGQPRGTFALSGSDWFPVPSRATTGAWRQAFRLLCDEHHTLRAVVADLPPHELSTNAVGGRTPKVSLIRGIAAHDLYHAGQIQLLKKLYAR